MRTLKLRFFTISAKVIIVYTSIIAVFTAAFLANYYFSKVEIDHKLTKVNEEYFSNKVGYIENAFKDMKNNAYDLRNLMAGNKNPEYQDPLEKFEQISRLTRITNKYDFIEDVFIYNTSAGYFISTLGTMDIGVYFRTLYSGEGLKNKWDEMLKGRSDIALNVTKYPDYDLPSRTDVFKRLLYIGKDYHENSSIVVGFIINVDNVVRNENKYNADINNFFVVKYDNENTLADFLQNNLGYGGYSGFMADGSIEIIKIENNYVYYQYDKIKNLIYLNVVNMDKYYDRLGYFNVLPLIITALLLLLIIAVASSFLSKFYRNLKSIRTVIEGDFVKNILEKQTVTGFMADVKDFIGLKGIRHINVMLLSASLKSVNVSEIDTVGYYSFFDRFLAGNGISFRNVNFVNLKRIYIIDAKTIKNFAVLQKSMQKLLSDYFDTNMEISVNVFVSGTYCEQDGMEKAINEAVYLSEKLPVRITNSVILLETDIPEEYRHMPDEFKNMLRNSLACSDKEYAYKLIEDLIGNNIRNGINLQNFKGLIEKVNVILLEAVFEKYSESYDDTVKVINKINNLINEVGAAHITDLYRELLSKINLLLPDDSKGKNRLLQSFTDYVKENYHRDVYLETMADYFRLSPKYVSAKFKEITGENFTDYLKNYRINAAREMLRNTQEKINVISEKVGYNNVNVFIRHFKSIEGITPKAYREIN